MTSPQDPRKTPLQDDELALARVLRALPAGEPSSKVDAAILAAATDAVNGGPEMLPARPRRPLPKAARWMLPSWAIGTAAAAVLAVGVGMQLRPPLESPRLPAAPADAAPSVRSEAEARLQVELPEPAAKPIPPTYPPPPPPPAPAPSRNRDAYSLPAQPAPAPVAAAPAAPPAEEPPAVANAFPTIEDEATLDSIDVTGSRQKRDAAAEARDTYEVTSSRLKQAEERERERAALAERREQSFAHFSGRLSAESGVAEAAETDAEAKSHGFAGDVAEGGASALPPVAEDARLYPESWLERIRERVRQGDRAGARASLEAFRKAYPNHAVPDDLAALR